MNVGRASWRVAALAACARVFLRLGIVLRSGPARRRPALSREEFLGGAMPYFVVTVTWPRWACEELSQGSSRLRRIRTWGRRRSGGYRRRRRSSRRRRGLGGWLRSSGLNSRSRGGSCCRPVLARGMVCMSDLSLSGCGYGSATADPLWGITTRKATSTAKARWRSVKAVATEGRSGGRSGAGQGPGWCGWGLRSRSMGRLRCCRCRCW